MPDHHFADADLYVKHLSENPNVALDAFIASRHVGFVAVSAVTVYEIALKNIFMDFGAKKHVVLGNFTKVRFDRINGRIAYKVIWEEYIKMFGDKYVVRFKKKIANAEKEALRKRGRSIVTSYNNIVTWRNAFAHEGRTPENVTLVEVVESYQEGKNILRCLASSMVR